MASQEEGGELGSLKIIMRVSAPNKLLCYDVVVDNLIKTEIKNKNSKQSQIPQIYSGSKLLAPTSTIQDTT